RVEFFIDGVKVMESNAPPFNLLWTNVPIGNYALSVAATVDAVARTTSSVFNISVKELLISAGAVWKYLDNGSDQGTAWRAIVFNDSGWASGLAQLGFGDGDEATVINGGPSNSRFATTYFRRAFVVTNSAAYTNVMVSLLRDDGAIVYLNGTEVFRSNMPTGAVTYLTHASAVVNVPQESAFYSTNFSPSLFVFGTNVLAVELHQANAISSDLSFDLELVADVAS